jgi:hypothetical protein
LSSFLAFGMLFLADPALAAADVRVVIPAPAAVHVYDDTEYEVVVSNIGNKTASSVSLTIQLPATHTSPTVHVMGTLSNVDSRCAASGTRLVCALGSMNKNTSKTVTFDIALPEAAEVLSVTATATTSSAENSTANNSDADTPALDNHVIAVAAGNAAHNEHCTGTGLTSFFECTLYPSSISSHDIVFGTLGTLSIVGEPDYSGSWSQPTTDSLVFSYSYGPDVVAEFEGYGSHTDCFEGITTFPTGPYVAPYRVCLTP